MGTFTTDIFCVPVKQGLYGTPIKPLEIILMLSKEISQDLVFCPTALEPVGIFKNIEKTWTDPMQSAVCFNVPSQRCVLNHVVLQIIRDFELAWKP